LQISQQSLTPEAVGDPEVKQTLLALAASPETCLAVCVDRDLGVGMAQ